MSKISLTAIAVDDEQHCLDTLAWELERVCPEVTLIDTINDADIARQKIPDIDIDILFMDIHLQSTSGISLVKELQPLDCEVIFVTAYDQYAIEAFEVEALHYLLKPINKDHLRAAVNRVITHKKEQEKATVDRILSVLADTQSKRQKIPFSIHSGIEFINPDHITYVSGESNYSVLHFTNRKNLIVSKTLRAVEEQLQELTFMRIHKSYLLNLQHIIRYVKTDGGYIEVYGGDKLAVSRTKRSVIKELFT